VPNAKVSRDCSSHKRSSSKKLLGSLKMQLIVRITLMISMTWTLRI